MSTAATPHEGPSTGEPAAPGFQQRLGLFDATMLVAGTMIGSGIFIVSADMARDLGCTGWLLAAWVLTGFMTIIGALSYAELAAMMPHAGGQYVYLREAYSPLWGFLYGWSCFLVIQTGSIAAVSVAFAKFFGVLVPALGTDNLLWERKGLDIDLALPIPWLEEPLSFFKREAFAISAGQLVAVVVTVLLSLVNCLGVREGKWVQNTFTVAKTAGLILLIVLGLTIAVHPAAVAQNFGSEPWSGIFDTKSFQGVSQFMPLAGVAIVMVLSGAMVGSLFAADAWNNVTFTAGEVQNPRRNLPLSLALGTGLVIVLYLLANLAYVAALPVRGDQEAALKLVAQAKKAEAQEAGYQANVKHLAAELAVVEYELHQAKLALQKETVPVGLEEEIKAKEQVRQLFIKKVEEERTRALNASGEGKKLTVEAAFARGIDHAKDDRVGTAVLERASPNFGVPIMAIAIMISTFGCVNGMILMGARLYWAMGQDRLFFASVGRLNQRGVPAAGLILQGLWSVLLIFSGTYSELLDYVIFAALLFYVLTVAGLFILRRKLPAAPRPYRAFGYPLVPALYVALCAVIMVSLLFVKPVYSWPSFLIILSGIPVYFLWQGRR